MKVTYSVTRQQINFYMYAYSSIKLGNKCVKEVFHTLSFIAISYYIYCVCYACYYCLLKPLLKIRL